MQLVRESVEQGHSLRKTANVKLRQPLASFSYTGNRLAKEFEEILTDELNVKQVKFGKTLEFALELTPELKQEGLARELERAVQEMRKQKGLKVGEQALLSYNTDDEEIASAFELFDTKKTYIGQLKHERGLVGDPIEIEGKKLVLKLG